MTYTERISIDCIDTFENFLEDRGVRVSSSDALMAEEGALEGNSARIYGEDFGELQGALAFDIGWSIKRVSECVYDLTLICANYIRETDVDSRVMFDQIHDLALAFEEQYNDEEDYMTAIEEFGQRKLAELRANEPVTYHTYPDMFLDYDEMIENENYDHEVRIITVPRAWATDWVRDHYGMDLDAYENEYDYNDSFEMYEDAMRDGVLLSSVIEEEGWR